MDSQDRKFLLIGVSLIAAFMIVAVLVLRKKPGGMEPTTAPSPEAVLPGKQFDTVLDANTPCPGPEIKYRMVDESMKGIVEKGQEVQAITNFFACNPIKKGDLVLYRFSKANDPVIRRVVAVEGDVFKLQKDSKKRAWNVLINGQPLRSVSGEVYAFGFDAPPPLSLYEKPRQGKLQKDEVLVFCSHPPSEQDSGTFGVTSKGDMVAVIPNVSP